MRVERATTEEYPLNPTSNNPGPIYRPYTLNPKPKTEIHSA